MADFTPRKALCANDGKPYMKTREDHRFCSDACRKEFHRNGGVSFARQKYLIEQEVEKQMKAAESRMLQKLLNVVRRRADKETARAIEAEMQGASNA